MLFRMLRNNCGVWSEECGVRIVLEIQYSYIKSLVLETYLTPHSTLHIPHKLIILPQSLLQSTVVPASYSL